MIVTALSEQPCNKLLTAFSKLVDNLEQAVRTHLVDGLFADLLQAVRFLRVYMEHHCNTRSPPDEQTRLECRNVGSCMQVGRDFYLFKHNQSCERSMMITCFIFHTFLVF